VDQFHGLLYAIKDQFYLFFNFEVKFIRRQTNTIAHTLTRVTYFCASRRIF